MEALKSKPVSFHQNNERSSFRTTPLKPLKHSISLHKTSAGLKSRVTQDELPIINDFYLSDLSTATKHNNALIKHPFSDMKSFLNTEEINAPISRNNNIYELLPPTMREFVHIKKEFMVILDNFDKISYCLDLISEKTKCYRPELGNLLDKSHKGYQNLFEKMLKATMSLFEEFEGKSKIQVNLLLEQITALDKDKKDMQIKINNLRSLNNFQESEYKICKMNCDSLQSELVLLHELLKKDINSLISHVGVIESVNQKGMINNDLSDKLIDLNNLIENLEAEQSNKKNVIDSMNNLLKAMLKGGKCDAVTQVNEVELMWQAQTVIETADMKIMRVPTYNEIETGSINLDKFSKEPMDLNNIETVKLKENEQKIDIDDKERGNAWSLPATLIVFLENVTKNNECGRVLPWIHFKKSVYGVYNERLNLQNDIKGCFNFNAIPMDEFLCLYFIKMHKVRRLAEIKLLEFLISLKYYAKIWPRALTFANLCNIIPYTKPPQENFPYNFDLYVQEYFFYCYSKVTGEKEFILEHGEGQTYLKKEKLEEITKNLVYFDSDIEKKKFLAKLNKYCRKLDTTEGENIEAVDIDKLLEFSIDEYFEMKKRNFKSLSKKFSKTFETDNGLISFDDYKVMLTEITDLESPIERYKYSNEIIKLRSYLYCITSGKNKNDIVQKDFNATVLRFGIDCPFPLIFSLKKNYRFSEKSNKMLVEVEKKEDMEKNKENSRLSKSPTIDNIIDKSMDIKNASNASFAIDKKTYSGDSNSALFGQHFTILRELNVYCKQFKEAIGVETDTETLMKHFDNISKIVEIACQFLRFPIKL